MALAASSEAISTRSLTRVVVSRVRSACAATARRSDGRSVPVNGWSSSSRASSAVSVVARPGSGSGLVLIDDHHDGTGKLVEAEHLKHLGGLGLAAHRHPLPRR